jgi:phosphomannomutase
MINPNIFKSYDIRGIYPSELNDEAAFDVGKSFIKHTGAKKVVLCYDARNSAPALFKALSGGIKAEGADVYGIGQAPTECLYFAVGNYDFDAGIMITASHNPKEYNGLKMITKIGNDIKMVRGMDLLSVIKDSSFVASPVRGAEAGKEIIKKDIWQDYINYILSFTDLSEIVPLKIIVDASSGVGGLVISKIKDKLPVEIIPLNFEPDGNFPSHSPNPLEAGSADKISETVKREKADFGIMFDGDADRMFLVDEAGQLVKADATLLLMAKYFLEKNPGVAIAYNAICSKAVPEFIKQWGGKPIRTKVGFINVREGLLQNNGIMGGELSGHYCFRDNYYMDSGMISFLTLLQIISKDGRNVSEIIKELSPYVKSPELNFKVEDKDMVLEKVKQKYSDGKQDFLDGVTVEYKDWWFNVRPSNTEPLLRLTIETDTQELLAEKQKELTELITK